MKRCPICTEIKPLNLFFKDKSRPDGHSALCKPCKTAKLGAWRDKNREHYNEYMKGARKRPANKERAQSNKLLKTYGITLEEKREIHAKQGNVCAICEKDPHPHRESMMDHDHRTDKVRGVLCFKCNSGLYFLENPDYLRRAIAYLAHHGSEVFVHINTPQDGEAE